MALALRTSERQRGEIPRRLGMTVTPPGSAPQGRAAVLSTAVIPSEAEESRVHGTRSSDERTSTRRDPSQALDDSYAASIRASGAGCRPEYGCHSERSRGI